MNTTTNMTTATNTSANIDVFGNILNKNVDVFEYDLENKYAFTFNPISGEDEKYYSYYIRDFVGDQYLIPIDHPFAGGKKSIDNCNLMSIELVVRRAIDKAIESMALKNFKYSVNMIVSLDTIMYSIINVSATQHINNKFQCTMCTEEETIRYIGSDCVKKIKTFQDLLDCLYSDFNKIAIKQLVESFIKKVPENPLVAWFQENE